MSLLGPSAALLGRSKYHEQHYPARMAQACQGVSILTVLIVALALGGAVQAEDLASDPPPPLPTQETVNKNESGSLDLESAAAAPAGPAFIQDGGFELGSPNPSWSEFSTCCDSPLWTSDWGVGGGTGPHSGTWWAWFGGVSPGIEEGLVMQTDTFPAGTCELSFWLEIPASGGTGNDYLGVWIDSDLLFSITDLDAGSFPTYQQVWLDVSSYDDGASHDLLFYSWTSGSGTTSFFVDDVVLDPDPLLSAMYGPATGPGSSSMRWRRLA